MRGPMIITEGMKIYDEGITEGIIKQQIETAKNMLIKGLSDDLIIECSHITSDKLDKLKAEMSKS